LEAVFFKKAQSQGACQDHIVVRRLKDKLSLAEARAANAERVKINSTIREGILDLAAIPLEPRSSSPAASDKKGPQGAFVLMICDVHMRPSD